MSDESIIKTHSIVSNRTHKGVVVISWGEISGQFDPEDARQFAHAILRECDNAETDAFLYQFGRAELEDERAAHVLITEYRKHRARLEQLAGLRRKETGSEIPPEERR